MQLMVIFYLLSICLETSKEEFYIRVNALVRNQEGDNF